MVPREERRREPESVAPRVPEGGGGEEVHRHLHGRPQGSRRLHHGQDRDEREHRHHRPRARFRGRARRRRREARPRGRGRRRRRARRSRALRTRNSALQCDTNFGAVLDFFGAPRGSELDGRGGAKKKEQKEAPVPDIAPLKTDRFADVTKNEMNREAFGKDFADLGIDTEGGFLDAARPRALPRLSELAPAGPGGEARASGPAVSRSSSKPAKPRRALGEGARPSSSSPRDTALTSCSTCTTSVSSWRGRSS